MKNRFSLILCIVTGLFLAFTLGVFLGRASSGGGVQISASAESALAPLPGSTDSTDASSLTLEETQPPPEAISFPIDINTATAAMLDALPGIGPVLAQRIVDYREANGNFTALSQLTNVEGIGSKRLEEILELITIQQEDIP